VPLAWYHSTTYAYFDDETHASIRRVYSSPSERGAKRFFCGFCGTQLSYWSEVPRGEGEFISLTLGSLNGGDLRDLDVLGLLPEGEEGAQKEEANVTVIGGGHGGHGGGEVEGVVVPWFESMLQGSTLGRVRRSRGTRQTGDGSVRMEWEILELLPEEEAQGTGKRKIGDVEAPDVVADERQ
jgi:hypothetical protein